MQLEEAKQKMDKSVNALQDEYKVLRSGRASVAIFDKIRITQYEQSMPLNQLASVSIQDARTIIIKPWDKASIQSIDKAIQAANLGLTPANDGNIIRITIPPLSGERRTEIVKQAKQIAENYRVAIRNIRRSANETLRSQLKASEISEDEEHTTVGQIDKVTEQHITQIDSMLEKKEKEIMEN